MVRINGNDIDAAGVSVEEHLKETGIETKRVAVEINGDIVPKAEYSERTFKDGDVCEIVHFVGGG